MADLSLMQNVYLVADAEDTQKEEHFQELTDDFHCSSADEAMPPLQRVEKYAKSDQPFDRQMVPRVMQAAFRSAPPDQLTKDLPHLMQIISKIADEDEINVRSDLLEQIPNLAETGVECSARCPALTTLVSDHLLPLVVRHLTTLDYHVLKVAQHTLLILLERALVTRVQAEIQVCPTILSLSRREQEKEFGIDFQSGAVTLMSKMAPLLGRDVMERVFLERFAELCANATFNIRMLCATHLSNFAAVVGREAYENVLLPSYLTLCTDENWSVRKACAEAAVGVSCVCPTASLRHCTLAPLYTRLLKDCSRWVRSAAFQGLGPFISTFAQQPGGVITLSYNAQGELVLLNKYGCEFEVQSITPAIEDMKHFVNMSVMSDEPEIDYGDGFNPLAQRLSKSISQRTWTATAKEPGPCSTWSDDADSDSDDSGQSIMDIDEQLSTLCMYNRAVKVSDTSQGRLRSGGMTEDAKGPGPFTNSNSPSISRLGPQSQPVQDAINVDQLLENSTSVVVNCTEISKNSSETEEERENIPNQQPSNCSKNIINGNKARRDYLASLQSSGDNTILLPSTTSPPSCSPRQSTNSGNKIILFKGDVLRTLDTGHIEQETALKSGCLSIAPCSDYSCKSSDDSEQFNSYYYWYVSPDMPLDPDIVDAGVPLSSTPFTSLVLPSAQPMPMAAATDVVPQASHSMNNLNNVSFNSSSILRNTDGDNICGLYNSTLNLIHPECFNFTSETSNQNTNGKEPETTVENFSTSATALDTFNLESLLLNDPSQQNDDRLSTNNSLFPDLPTLNSTFTLDVDKTACDSGNSENGPSLEPSQHIVPQQLIDHFTSMAHRQLEESTNPDIAYYCAYSLPAVALTLGSENWHLLRGTVETLAQHAFYKVRLTVASCLHELAVILGPEIASEYLTVIFDGFIKDLDEVRIGILKHMAHFLILISPAKRCHYLSLFMEFLRIDNQLNWRFQLQLAVQLRLVVPLYRPMDVLRHIFSIGLVLLHHGVAVARRTAIMLVTEVFKYCNKKKKTTSNLLVKVAETLAHATLWKLRQTFALLAAELVRQDALPPKVFAVEVLPHLLDLSWDPVAVVRLSVGRTIAAHIITKDYYKDPNNQHYDTLQTVLRRLQADKDKDVRDFSNIIVKETETESESPSQ